MNSALFFWLACVTSSTGFFALLKANNVEGRTRQPVEFS